MKITLTPEVAKVARQKTHLSQDKVATDLGINRAYLSLFESGKYLFDECLLSSLRAYYEEKGYVFDSIQDIGDHAKAELPFHQKARVKDGFEIPSEIDEIEAERLLAAYKENRNKIISLCQQHPKEILFWIDEDDLENRKREVFTLMARNYALIEQLRGRRVTLPGDQAVMSTKRTIGEYVSDLLS